LASLSVGGLRREFVDEVIHSIAGVTLDPGKRDVAIPFEH
jgi:hypothetical protein